MGSREGGDDLFSLGNDDRMCGKGTKLFQGEVETEYWENFFTVRVVKHWNRLLREVAVVA